jgi:nucleotide-binding universal stress UspA family protein
MGRSMLPAQAAKENVMSIKTVTLGVIVEDEVSSSDTIAYAVSLCEREGAHLSCQIAAPVLDPPTGRLLALVQAMVDQVNAERLARAEQTREKLEAACRLAGVPFGCRIMQKSYVEARAALIDAARASDLVVMPRPNGLLSSSEGMDEGLLFASGRPVICVPPAWAAGAQFRKIVVAWDGGARAARAVGDAMGFLERADEVEIVSVAPDGSKSLEGADLAEHLSRHCSRLRLTDLPLAHADAGRTIREYSEAARPDLLVMGAFAHSRLLQFVVGGVTSTMLGEAKVPVLYAY